MCATASSPNPEASRGANKRKTRKKSSLRKFKCAYVDQGTDPARFPTPYLGLHVGSCQNRGPFSGTLNNRRRNILGTPKGTIILTTTHVLITLPETLSCCSEKEPTTDRDFPGPYLEAQGCGSLGLATPAGCRVEILAHASTLAALGSGLKVSGTSACLSLSLCLSLSVSDI